MTLSTYARGEIIIGDNVFIGAGTFIVAGDSKISIGNDCLIAEYVGVRTANHGFLKDGLIRNQPSNEADITIGTDVWLGRCVSILKGASIDDGCVVGANSVVSKKRLEGYSIYAGVPATLIRRRH